MGNHYFIADKELKHDIRIISQEISGRLYRFSTDSGVFSKKKVDYGTLLLIKSLDFENKEAKFLDLGSGYGPIGIVIKKKYPFLVVDQTDINDRAIDLCKINAKENNVITNAFISDGFENNNQMYNYITLNPPIKAGKVVVYRLYSEVYNHLMEGGLFFVVVAKRQGALSHLKYLKGLFGNATILNKSKGYHVIKMEKQKKT